MHDCMSAWVLGEWGDGMMGRNLENCHWSLVISSCMIAWVMGVWGDGMLEYWNDGMAPFGQILYAFGNAHKIVSFIT